MVFMTEVMGQNASSKAETGTSPPQNSEVPPEHTGNVSETTNFHCRDQAGDPAAGDLTMPDPASESNGGLPSEESPLRVNPAAAELDCESTEAMTLNQQGIEIGSENADVGAEGSDQQEHQLGNIDILDGAVGYDDLGGSGDGPESAFNISAAMALYDMHRETEAQGLQNMEICVEEARRNHQMKNLSNAEANIEVGLRIFHNHDPWEHPQAERVATVLHNLKGLVRLNVGDFLAGSLQFNEAVLLSNGESAVVMENKCVCLFNLLTWLQSNGNCITHIKAVLEYLDRCEEIAGQMQRAQCRFTVMWEAAGVAEIAWKTQNHCVTTKRVREMFVTAGNACFISNAEPLVIKTCADKAIEYEGEDDLAALKLAVLVHLKLGSFREAKRFLAHGLTIQPQDPELMRLEATLPFLQHSAVKENKKDDDGDMEELRREIEKQEGLSKRKVELAREKHQQKQQKKKKGQMMKGVPRKRTPNDEVPAEAVQNVTAEKQPCPDRSSTPITKSALWMEAQHTSSEKGIPSKSADGQKTRTPVPVRTAYNPASLDLLFEIKKSLDIRLACSKCWMKKDVDASFSYQPTLHSGSKSICIGDTVLVKPKESMTDWCAVRMRNTKYQGEGQLCTNSQRGVRCIRIYKQAGCPEPHNEHEKRLWDEDYRKHIKLDTFIHDLKESTLFSFGMVKALIDDTKGTLQFLCKPCHSRDDLVSKKQKHNPACVKGHIWSPENKGLAFVAVGEQREQDVVFIDSSGDGNDPIVARVQNCLDCLNQYGYTRDDLVAQSNQLKQTKKALEDRASLPVCHYERTRYDSAHGSSCSEPEEEYICLDKHLLDMMADNEMDAYCIPEPPEYDQDESDWYRESSGDAYYTVHDRDKLEDLLRGDPSTYKLCMIHLDGAQRGICRPVDPEDDISEIEIRGRANCGPVFDGDQVVIQICEVAELDTDHKVTRGMVMGVYKSNTTRKTYTFVCTVDKYSSALMKPICGRAPKIHVVDDVLKNRYGDKRNEYVAVHDDQLQLLQVYKLCPATIHEFLFVVRYLKWDPNHMYPLGYVVKVIPAGTTPERSQKVLDLVYQLHTYVDYKPEFFVDLNGKALRKGRTDMTSLYSISIDPEGCRDIDDALSVQAIDSSVLGDLYEVSVHIADVSHYVQQGSDTDQEARRRGCSFYPYFGQQTHNMLPKELSEDRCSLLPDTDRPAISVIFKMNSDARLVEAPIIKKSIIQNKRQLTYREAQNLIDASESEDSQDDLNTTVLNLHILSQALRKNRLGVGQPYIDQQDDDSLDAHILIEEFMILTNSAIAEFLERHFQICTPVRMQRSPKQGPLNHWCDDFQEIAPLSFCLKRYCDHIFVNREEVEQQTNRSLTHIPITYTVVDQLNKALSHRDPLLVKRIIGTEHNHPLHAVALVNWYKVQMKAEYDCTQGPRMPHDHFSLGLRSYTHFTSPIRRYFDIVVHRLVKAVLCGHDSPYGVDDIEDICTEINRRMIDSKSYHKECGHLRLVENLKKEPRFVPAVIDSIDDNKLSLCIPDLPGGSKTTKAIRYSSLNVCSKPDTREDNAVCLPWKKRMYDANGYHPNARTKQLSMERITLSAKNHVHMVPTADWETILGQISNQESDNELMHEVEEMVNSAQVTMKGRTEVTSEMKQSKELFRHHVEFDIKYQRADVLHLQLAAKLDRGLLQPYMTLLNLTEQNDICVEHMNQPVECFTDLATLKTKTQYQTIEEYQRIWRPILAMEAVNSSISDGDSVIVHHVPLQLSLTRGVYHGSLSLALVFCKERSIKLIKNTKDGDEESHDYLCIRYPLISHNNVIVRNMWTGHAVALEALVGEDANVILKFHLQSNRVSPPDALLRPTGDTCTVEFHAKSLPHRRMDEALIGLDGASDLTKQIVLGKTLDTITKVPNPPLVTNVPKALCIPHTEKKLPGNNASQESAIRAGLTRPLTLIQGPPGTGKTLTGIKLVYWFVQMNKRNEEGTIQGQVMYCGPSNSSVDVATKLLTERLGDECPKIVRVYSDTLERQVFPVPRDSLSSCNRKGRKYELIAKDEHNNVALHHLIRKPENPFSRDIRQFDKLFKKNKHHPENVSDEQVEKYMKLITDASVHELPKYDVILCTCTLSASPRVTRGCNVAQCIIDECGMCMEPESLIPLVTLKPKQVVLVGDHKQLRPIVKNSTAQELGLEISLFERHSKRAIMLQEQYRMHPGICEFPSQHFYKGDLVPASRGVAWELHQIPVWHNRARPIVFCHVEGAEKALAVSTDEGNESSRSNVAERDHAVRIFSELVNSYRVKQKQIAVMSQYRAQCSEIYRNLEDRGFENPNVDTVVASQGNEWNFVILSLVRSLPQYEIEKRPSIGWLKKNMGFICDANQINVALTRAMNGLIILGNKNLLGKDPMWRELLKHYDNYGCLMDAEKFLKRRGR